MSFGSKPKSVVKRKTLANTTLTAGQLRADITKTTSKNSQNSQREHDEQLQTQLNGWYESPDLPQRKDQKAYIGEHVRDSVGHHNTLQAYTGAVLIRVPGLRDWRALKDCRCHDCNGPGEDHGTEDEAGDSHAVVIEGADVHEEECDLDECNCGDIDAFKSKKCLITLERNAPWIEGMEFFTFLWMMSTSGLRDEEGIPRP